MSKIVGLKKLRYDIDTFVNAIQKKSESFIVVRRSKPIFKIVPLNEEDEIWEPIIDFTKYKKGGVALKELLSRL